MKLLNLIIVSCVVGITGSLVLLSGCTRTCEVVEESSNPTVIISGHYTETFKTDPETMRKAAEMQLVISREIEACQSDN